MVLRSKNAVRKRNQNISLGNDFTKSYRHAKCKNVNDRDFFANTAYNLFYFGQNAKPESERIGYDTKMKQFKNRKKIKKNFLTM